VWKVRLPAADNGNRRSRRRRRVGCTVSGLRSRRPGPARNAPATAAMDSGSNAWSRTIPPVRNSQRWNTQRTADKICGPNRRPTSGQKFPRRRSRRHGPIRPTISIPHYRSLSPQHPSPATAPTTTVTATAPTSSEQPPICRAVRRRSPPRVRRTSVPHRLWAISGTPVRPAATGLVSGDRLKRQAMATPRSAGWTVQDRCRTRVIGVRTVRTTAERLECPSPEPQSPRLHKPRLHKLTPRNRGPQSPRPQHPKHRLQHLEHRHLKHRYLKLHSPDLPSRRRLSHGSKEPVR